MTWLSSGHINDQLNKAQQLLWGGSETENIKAHNIIAELIKDLEFQKIVGAD